VLAPFFQRSVRTPGLVARTGPPVECVRAGGARHAPAGMHVEYVPGVWPADVSACRPISNNLGCVKKTACVGQRAVFLAQHSDALDASDAISGGVSQRGCNGQVCSWFLKIRTRSAPPMTSCVRFAGAAPLQLLQRAPRLLIPITNHPPRALKVSSLFL
jgi:hypothetical protein